MIQFITIISIIIYMYIILKLFKKTPFYIVMFFSIILLSFWRIVSSFYIELHDRLYSREIFDYITLHHGSTIILISYYFLLFSIIYIVFSGRELNRLSILKTKYLKKDISFCGFPLYYYIYIFLLCLVLILLIDIIRFGHRIPLLSGVERYDFQHTLLMSFFLKYQSLIFIFLGVSYYYAHTNLRVRLKKKIIYTLFLYMLYLLLLGNKFSAFFINFSFFILPIALIFLDYKWNKKLLNSLIKYITISSSILFFFVYVKFSYIVNERGKSIIEAKDDVIERIFVQQNELFSHAFHRLFILKHYNFEEAIYNIFINKSHLPGTNTSLHYIMYQELPYNNYMNVHQQYTGAFPQIIIEMFGVYGSYVILSIVYLIMSFLLIIFYKAILKKHYMTLVFAAFVVQPFIIFTLSGKMIFLVQYKYYLKVLLLIISILFEGNLYKYINLKNKKNNPVKNNLKGEKKLKR